MTVESDIRTALSSYSVKHVVYASYSKPTTNSVAVHVVEVAVVHPTLATITTITSTLQAMSYKSIRARCVSSWPHSADLYYSRFEVEIQQ